MAEYPEHPIVSDARTFRGYGDDVSAEEIYKHEALKLSLMGPEQRAVALRDFNNKITMYDESGTNLRQIAQAHRFGSYLKNASDRIRAAGR